MAATLDDLANLDGVLMAFEFAPDGTLKQYKAPGNVPQELAQQVAKYSATVTMLFGTLAGAFTQLSQMPWTPQCGWGLPWRPIFGLYRGWRLPRPLHRDSK